MKAVLTGATGAIGLEIFKALSDSGFDIACCSRTATPALELLIAKNNAAGANHCFIALDLASDDSISEGLKQIESWTNKRVDALINCAGIAHGGLVNMTKMDELRHVFQVNYFGQIALTQRISRYIARNGGGRIVNVASNAGLRADRGTMSYGGSKAALIHTTQVMAAEYARDKIAVNAIAPSIVETDMAEQMDAKASQAILEMTNLGRMIKTSEVAELVRYLASESPISMTGEVIRLDGSMSF